MYKVYCDGALLYDPRVEELQLFEKKVSLEINKTGAFDFTIYPSHPLYNRIFRLKSSIEVYQDSFLLFRGRVLDDEVNFFNAKRVICEGDLAFLNDGIIRPYDYSGSVSGFLQFIVDTYNAQVEPEKRFTLGNVTVIDPNDYITRSSINAETAWDAITDKLVDMLGGYIMVRRVDGVNYLDYLVDSEHRSLQEITLGENLLDLTKNIKGQDIITALIPYGTRLDDAAGNQTDNRLTIADVNGGVDYVHNQEAVDLYGWIFGTSTWDYVAVPQNLLTKANAELARRINLNVAVEVNAVDLSMTDDEIDEFRFFEYVKVNSPAHLLTNYMLVTKLDIDMDNPQNNKLTLGLDYDTFTEKQVATEKIIKNLDAEVKETQTSLSNTIAQVQTTWQSNIAQSANEIRTEVARNYVATTDFSTYKESVSTQFKQTSDSFDFTFNDLVTQINTLGGETRAQFEDITKYIRFVNGGIVLGQVGNEITLQIQNDRIRFLHSGSEVAYFSNNKLYVTDIEVLNSIKIGNFAFIPRANGSLDFKKVVN